MASEDGRAPKVQDRLVYWTLKLRDIRDEMRDTIVSGKIEGERADDLKAIAEMVQGAAEDVDKLIVG